MVMEKHEPFQVVRLAILEIGEVDPHVGEPRGWATWFVKYLEGGLVHLHEYRLQEFLPHEINERLDNLTHRDGPAAQRRAADLDAQSGEDPLLAIEREAIGELRGEHIGQKPWGGDAPGNEPRGHRGTEHRRGSRAPEAFTGAGAIHSPQVPGDPDLRWDELDLLACLLVHERPLFPAGSAVLFLIRNVVGQDFAR